MLEEDNITNFFEVEEYIYSKDYIEEEIFCIQFPEGKSMGIS